MWKIGSSPILVVGQAERGLKYDFWIPQKNVEFEAIPSPIPTPMPSPTRLLDSLQIAYVSNEKLYMWSDGHAQFITSPASGIRISDDGDVIAFTRDGALWAINSDGTNERRLVSKEDFDMMEPQDPGVRLYTYDWLPRSHILLFNTELLFGYGINFTDDLHSIDADTLEYKQLLGASQGGEFYPAPDGSRIALVSPTRIDVVNPDGSGYQNLLEFDRVYTFSEYSHYVEPVWLSNSEEIMVAIPPHDYHKDTAVTQIWHIMLDGSITNIVSVFPAMGDANARKSYKVSPDFSKIAFVHTNTDGSCKFYTSNSDGSDKKMHFQRPQDCNYFLGWTADSKYFFFYIMGSTHLGTPDGKYLSLTKDIYRNVMWIDATHFFYSDEVNDHKVLYLGTIGAPSVEVLRLYNAFEIDFTLVE
jgi:hypothetical protein